MTTKRKHVYREGDHVLIVKPSFVERVGYPLTWIDVKTEIEDHPKLHEAMTLLGISTPRWNVRQHFIRGAAQALVGQRGFGGRERSIHRYERPEKAGFRAVIIGKRTVMTGTYYPPSGGGDDYDPGGLDKAKCHLILSTNFGEIEACNVEPVTACSR